MSRIVPDEINEAWQVFCRDLASLGDLLQSNPWYRGEACRAGAYRVLAKTLHSTLQQYVAEHDPRAPRLFRADFGFPNPDNLYLATDLSDQGSYRVYGRVGTANQTFFSLYKSTPQGSGTSGDRVRAQDLVLEPDGSFELWLTPERRSEHRNWLHVEPGTTTMSVYQIFADWDRETKGWFGIERTDSATPPPTQLQPADVSQRFRKAYETVEARLRYWQQLDERVFGATVDNEVAKPYRNSVSSLDILFSPGHWKVAVDEALLFEMRPPTDSIYWGFSVSDPWSEPLDYMDRQGSLNHAQVYNYEDGVIRLVLAHEDPGIWNWVDISGYQEGIFNWRVTSRTPPESPVTRLVKLSELSRHLPAETPRVMPEERQQIIARRRRHLHYRYSV